MLANIDGFGMAELDAKNLARMEEFVDAEFERADLNHDGSIDSDEFMLYYYCEICFKFPVGKNGYNPGMHHNQVIEPRQGGSELLRDLQQCLTKAVVVNCRGHTVQHLL